MTSNIIYTRENLIHEIEIYLAQSQRIDAEARFDAIGGGGGQVSPGMQDSAQT